MSQEQVAEQQEQGWLEQSDVQELPRRPRRRLLGPGGNPIPLALIGVLLIACGFIGGVLVEKSQSSSSSSSGSPSGLASRFAALRGSAGAGGASASVGRATSGAPGAAGFGGGTGGARATVGQVSYISGHTLYVTDAEGNTVKVKTSVASTVAKTVKANVKDIHPGETVIVTGGASANGAISAESIRVSEGATAGGLQALFGGGGAGLPRGGRGSGGTGAGAGSGEPALFGK